MSDTQVTDITPDQLDYFVSNAQILKEECQVKASKCFQTARICEGAFISTFGVTLSCTTMWLSGWPSFAKNNPVFNTVFIGSALLLCLRAESWRTNTMFYQRKGNSYEHLRDDSNNFRLSVRSGIYKMQHAKTEIDRLWGEQKRIDENEW